MMFTKGYEFTTGFTNFIIFIISFSFFLILLTKKNNTLWKYFYLFISLDGLLGMIIHMLNISSSLIDILWYILAFTFTITASILLFIFLNIKNNKYNCKHITILTSILYFILFIERLLKIEFLYTFITYIIFIFGICIYIIISKKRTKLYIYAIIFQIIGGILMLLKVKFLLLDYNGIYHIFMILTIIFFYLGLKYEN